MEVMKPSFTPAAAKGRLHVSDVRTDRLLTRIHDRPAAHGKAHTGPPAIGRHAGVGIGVGRGEARTITPIGEAREPDAPGLGALGGDAIELHAQLETAQPLEGIAPPRAVVDPLAHGLAEFAVAGDVDAHPLLTADDLDHRRAQPLLVRTLVEGLARLTGAVELDQIVGARQATRLCGEDPRAALLHGPVTSSRRAGRGRRGSP